MIKTNYEIIKAIVENNSNNRDISAKGTYKGLSLTRFVYYQLCYDYMKPEYSHTTAAKLLNMDHNNSRYALRKFDGHKRQDFFKYYANLYVDCGIALLELERKINLIITQDGKINRMEVQAN